MSIAPPVLAAERLAIRLGPIQPSVAISDLEDFARTGTIPSGLSLYSPFLNEEVRLALNSRVNLDPNVGDRLIEDLLRSSAGGRFLSILKNTIPDSTPKKLRTALLQAARQPEGLSLLSVMRAYPEEKITVDISAAIALGSQINLPYLQSQTLSSILERDLAVPSEYPLTSPLDPTLPGPRWVRQQTLIFRDYGRDRTIPVDLFWSRRSRGPLVVLSHGFGADRRFLSYLAYHLASYGFTVAALEHPASNVAWLTQLTSNSHFHGGGMGEILPATEFIDRPKDISFLLGELDRLERYSPMLRGRLNTHQVVVVGHSLGGYTALALAGAKLDLKQLRQFCQSSEPVGLTAADWLQCTASDLPDNVPVLQDQRVVRVIALNPVIGRLFNSQSLANLKIPTLMLSGTGDTITPAVSQQLLPFTQLGGEKYLLTAVGGTHLSVGDPTNLNQALTESLFVRERPGEETEALRHLLKGVTLAFVQQMTPNAERYKPFLSADYVQSFSSPTLQLRFNTRLSDKLVNWLKTAALPLEQVAIPQTLQISMPNGGGFEMGYGLYLLGGLPLVMFILPGSAPLAALRWFRAGGRSSRRKPPSLL